MSTAISIQSPSSNTANFSQARLDDLYDRGMYLQAYTEANIFAPFPHWPGPEGQVLAGKLAQQLGSSRLANRIFSRAWKQHRNHPLVAYYYAWQVFSFRGPLACLDFLDTVATDVSVAPRFRVDLHAAKCRSAAMLRDFETAEEFLAAAERIHPGLPWLNCERANLLELQDRYEESLAEVGKAFAIIPFYRPAVQQKVHLLSLAGRENEAVAFLQIAARSIESGALYAQLFNLQMELQQHAAALETMEQFLKHSPLLDKWSREWLDYRRCDALYFSGQFTQARQIAEQGKDEEFFRPFAARLKALEEQGESPKRKVLDIGFVRQHHFTCVPATLTTLCRYWGKPADHLAVAEKICYDGTPAHSERNWAEQNGFVAREFRVTTEAAAALIDRGIPFTLTTVETTSSHLQAVIGYDRSRETLYIRDPYLRHTVEFLAERSLKRYASSGPRGMAIVPKEQAARLDGIELPEAPLYDQLYELNLALERHDRTRAQQVYQNLRALTPEHRITLTARRTLGYYDGNNSEVAAALDALLRLFPEDGQLQIARINLWREQGERERRLEWLREECAKRSADPAILHEYAYELTGDARQEPKAMRLFERARRIRPIDAVNFHLTAGVLWNRREYQRAVQLYRFALSVEDKREQYARSYFIACRWLGETQKALGFLARRFTRFGAKSSAPAMTLFEAFEQLDQFTSAFSTLESAMSLRPDDAQLKLFAAEAYVRYALRDRARELLADAKPGARELSWLRTAAVVNDWAQDYTQALKYWRRLLQAEPLSIEANRACAYLLDLTEGSAAALTFLSTVRDRFPHHAALTQLLYEYSRNEPVPEQLAILTRLTELNPTDSWAWRETALVQGRSNQKEAALEAAQRGVEIEPNSTWSHGVLAWVQRQIGNLSAARDAYRHAIELHADNSDAANGLLECCETLAQKREALQFLSQQMERTIFGDIILSFHSVAAGIFSNDELERVLRQAHQRRPDLWQSWSALGETLASSGKIDAALSLAGEAANRFPLLPRVWLDLASVHRARLQHEEEIKALQHALQINPRWPLAWHELALAQERAGRPQESIAALQKGIVHEPRSAHTQTLLADFYLRYGPIDQARAPLQKAVELEPGRRWAWHLLQVYSTKSGEPDLALKLARSITQRRPGDIASWLALAELLSASEQMEERLNVIERAIALNPRNVEAREMKCIALVESRRFADAENAAAPADWAGPIPSLLRARSAWVQARRGDLRAAIEQMRLVLKDAPTLTFGWSELCSWLVDIQEFESALEPVEALLRLSPMAPVSHGYAGFVKLRVGKREEAKQHLRRAVQLDPSYTFGGFTLADAHINDGELEPAREALELMGPNAEPAPLLVRKLRIALAERQMSVAEQLFRELAVHPEASGHDCESAFEAFENSDPKSTGKILDELKELKEVRGRISTLWVLNRTRRGKWFFAGRLQPLLARNRVSGEDAIATYIEELARLIAAGGVSLVSFARRIVLRRVISRNREWLRQNDRGWGAVGYAFCMCGEYKRAADWLSDYAARKDAEAWMIHNYIDSCHMLGRDAEARAACEFALTLPAFGAGLNSPVLWFALENILVTDKPLLALGRLEPASFTDHERRMKALLDVLIRILHSTAREKCTSHDRATLRDFVTVHPAGNKWARRFSRRAVRAIARKTGQWWLPWLPI